MNNTEENPFSFKDRERLKKQIEDMPEEMKGSVEDFIREDNKRREEEAKKAYNPFSFKKIEPKRLPCWICGALTDINTIETEHVPPDEKCEYDRYYGFCQQCKRKTTFAVKPEIEHTSEEYKERLVETMKMVEEYKNHPLVHSLNYFSQIHVGNDIEQKTLMTGFLFILSCFFDNAILCVKGTSSAGKSHLVKTLLSVFPQEWIKEVGDLSPTALKYMVWDDIKILYIKEASGGEKTTEHLKLMSADDGGFKAVVTLGTPSTGFHTEEIDIPVKFIITTRAVGDFDSQLENRIFTIYVEDNEEQVKKIVLSKSDDNAGLKHIPRQDAITEFMKTLKPFDKIIVPYSYEFLNIIENFSTRLNRDFDKIILLIKASAFLNQYNRPQYMRDGKQVLCALPEDAYNVFSLSLQSFEYTITQTSKIDKKILEVLSEEPLTYKQLAKQTHTNKRTIIRRCEHLDDIGLIDINTERQTHVVSIATTRQRTEKKFNEYKMNILCYTAIELLQHFESIELPLKWDDIEHQINENVSWFMSWKTDFRQKNAISTVTTTETNCDIKNDFSKKNCDINCDTTVTFFYEIDEINEFFGGKTVKLCHFRINDVTVDVTVSPSRESVCFIYCDTVTFCTQTRVIDLTPRVLSCHSVTVSAMKMCRGFSEKKSMNEKIKEILVDCQAVIECGDKVTYDNLSSLYEPKLIDKLIEDGYLIKLPDGSYQPSVVPEAD